MRCSVIETNAVLAGMSKFATLMSGWHDISDGCLTARIVGEFSAGKTRLVSELLGDVLPPPLRPVSSREVQTRLQLEITYGEEVDLQVVERRSDFDFQGKLLHHLAQFPDRQQIEQLGLAPESHRLRLIMPMQELVLPQGDGLQEDAGPKRLFLIDMPGWNSGEDDIAERSANETMVGMQNLALVYVAHAMRLDSAGNALRLAEFMEALADATFIHGCHLLVVVTHCPEVDRERLQARAAAQVRAQWEQRDMPPDELTLTVQCVDFDHLTPEQLTAFRQQFWHALLAPVGEPAREEHPWAARIRSWPEAWQLAPRVARTQHMLSSLRAMLKRVYEGEKFLPGMNMRRLDGATPDEVRSKLQSEWRVRSQVQQLDPVLAGLEDLVLDKKHPLSAWWRLCWSDQMEALLDAVAHFYQEASRALDDVTPEVDDLEEHLRTRLLDAYRAAADAAHGSFSRMSDAIHQAGELAPEALLGTLLSLGVVQAGYEARCAHHLRQLPSRGQA